MLVTRMMLVLVVLMVLEELVVFVGGIFENGISPKKNCEKFIKIHKENFWCQIKPKNPAYGRQRISRPMQIVAPIPQ